MERYEEKGFDVGPRSWDAFGIAKDLEQLEAGSMHDAVHDPVQARLDKDFRAYQAERREREEEMRKRAERSDYNGVADRKIKTQDDQLDPRLAAAHARKRQRDSDKKAPEEEDNQPEE